MDLGKAILKEYSKTQVKKMVSYVGNDPKKFAVLVDLFLKGPYRITQRASWPMSYCVEAHPKLIGKHLPKIVNHLTTPGVHSAVKRNILRLLQFVDIPVKCRGPIVDVCFSSLQTKNEPVAVKAFSITVLAKLIEHEPDLARELKIILEDQLPYASAAIRVRARRFLKTSP